MYCSIGEEEWRGKIICHAFGSEFREDRKIDGAIRVCQAAPDRFFGEVDPGDRTVEKIAAFKQFVRCLSSLDLGTRPPDKPPSHDIGVKGSYEHGDPPQRNAAGDEPLGQLRQHLMRLRRRSGAVDQPIHNRSDLLVRHCDRIDGCEVTAHIMGMVPTWGAKWR